MKSVVLSSQKGNSRYWDHVLRPNSQEEPGFQFPENAKSKKFQESKIEIIHNFMWSHFYMHACVHTCTCAYTPAIFLSFSSISSSMSTIKKNKHRKMRKFLLFDRIKLWNLPRSPNSLAGKQRFIGLLVKLGT